MVGGDVTAARRLHARWQLEKLLEVALLALLVVEGAVLDRAFIFGLLARHGPVGVRVEIHFVVRVRQRALVPVVAVLYAGGGARVLPPARDRQVRQFSVALEERPPILPNLVGVPARIQALANVLVLFRACIERLRTLYIVRETVARLSLGNE